jgi:hypothetical protein
MTQALFKMSRPNNLLMIVFAMFAFRFGFAHTIAPKEFVEWMQFLGMILTIVLITAGGNFINDYFDVRVDRINKPDAVYVESKVKRRVVILSHIVATTLGVLISFFVGKSMHSYLPFVVAIVVSIALGLYTPFFKKRVLSGNLLVSLCIGMIPLWSVWPNLSNLHIGFWTLIFSVFAFSVNFSREIVKDIEDLDGLLDDIEVGERRTDEEDANAVVEEQGLLILFPRSDAVRINTSHTATHAAAHAAHATAHAAHAAAHAAHAAHAHAATTHAAAAHTTGTTGTTGATGHHRQGEIQTAGHEELTDNNLNVGREVRAGDTGDSRTTHTTNGDIVDVSSNFSDF